MKTLTTFFVIMFALILLSFSSCKRDDSWTAGGPVDALLIGTWKLERIVTPNHTISDKQIGYSEILKIRNNDGFDIEETFRNDSLIVTHYKRRNPIPIAKAKDMTVLITYRYDLQRFYKMYRTVSQPTILEASAYLPEIGGVSDTVKFFYREVR